MLALLRSFWLRPLNVCPKGSGAGLQLGGVRLAVLTRVAVARTGTVSFH